jgi:hypothetical protein
MDKEKKDRIREIARGIIANHIECAVDDTFSDSYIRDEIWDNLPDDLSNDKEVEHCMLEGDESGSIDNEPVEKVIDELTDSFMERFEE